MLMLHVKSGKKMWLTLNLEFIYQIIEIMETDSVETSEFIRNVWEPISWLAE